MSETSFKQRWQQFESLLNMNQDGDDIGNRHRNCIDISLFREACFYGIPDESGLRPVAWKVLLRYLPPEKDRWNDIMFEQRLSYYHWVQDLLETPGDQVPVVTENISPDSPWGIYFQDNVMLEQIDKDVRRTLPDLAFFQLNVPPTPLSPLSPPAPNMDDNEAVELQSSKSSPRRLSFGITGRPRSSSSASKISKISLSDQRRPRSNSKSSVRSFSSGILESGSELIQTPRKIVHKISSAFSKSSSPSSSPYPKKRSTFSIKPTCPPVKNRRALFRRIPQSQNEGGLRNHDDGNGNLDAGDYRVPDYHWEAIERILFIYAKLNPGVGYVQGMNELLAPIYYVFAKDGSIEDRSHAEADAFFVFTSLMSDVRDHFVRSLDEDTTTGINATMARMNQRLAWYDRTLWLDLERKQVKLQYYAFRWITVLLSQEWDLPDVIRLWDSLLAQPDEDTSMSDFLLDITVAMVTCVRDSILQGEFADIVRLLQNYPIPDLHIVLNKAYEIRDHRRAAIQAGYRGSYAYDMSDTSSFTSVESNSRLRRLKDSTRMARASLDAFRRESRDSIDELFRKGLSMTRQNSDTTTSPKGMMRSLSSRVSDRLMTRMNRSRSGESQLSISSKMSTASWAGPITTTGSTSVSAASAAKEDDGVWQTPHRSSSLTPTSLPNRPNALLGRSGHATSSASSASTAHAFPPVTPASHKGIGPPSPVPDKHKPILSTPLS